MYKNWNENLLIYKIQQQQTFNMTIEHFNTFMNICAEHSWKIRNVFQNNVDFGEFEEIRKEDYPYDPRDFADYMSTVFELLHNEDAKIIDDNLGIPIYPLHGDAEMTHQRSEFIQYFQEIYDTICSQGYSPMSESEDDNNTNTAVDSDDESDDESEDDNTEEHNHAYFEENYEPHIDVQDFDEIRRLLMFDDEIELPEQE